MSPFTFFLLSFVFHGTLIVASSYDNEIAVELKARCPVKWSWGPWSQCDPVTCTRYRRRRCELPMTCFREVCMDKAYTKQRSVVRRYRPCSLKDRVKFCQQKPVTRHWGSAPFVSFDSGSRFSAFQKPSRLWRQLTPIYIEEPLMNPPNKRFRRKKQSSNVEDPPPLYPTMIRTAFKRNDNGAEKIVGISTTITPVTVISSTEMIANASSSAFATFFGSWSAWSPCELVDSSSNNYKPVVICAQMRTRVCSVASICGDYVLLHRRRCRPTMCFNQKLPNETQTPPINSSATNLVFLQTTPTTLMTVSERPPTSLSLTNVTSDHHDEAKSSIFEQFNTPAVIPSTISVDTSPPIALTSSRQQCGVSELMSQKTPRIIGGRLVPRGKWPWMVVLVNRRSEQFCGGALIANQWVLTAAHCLDRVAAIRVGEHALDRYDPGEMTMRPAAIFAHPSYNPDDFDSDIGLILLDKPLNYSKFIIPACLPPAERDRNPTPPGTPEVGGGLRAGTLCTVVGWGKLAEHYPTGSARPREVRVPIVSRQACKKAYADQLTATQICAGYLQGGRDSCGGDSGGPLMCQEQVTLTERTLNTKGEMQTTSRVAFRWVVEGLVSHGDGCGLQMKYGVYTRVDAFIDWVNAIINRPEAFLGRK